LSDLAAGGYYLSEMPPKSDATPDWERLRPVLDEAMSELSDPDFDALLMRFFKNQDLRSVGLALGLKILWDRDETSAGDSRRFNAAEQLRNLGPQAVAGLSAFRELLHSGSQETSYAGARALAFTSEASPEAFQELSNALSDPDAQVRDAATHGIGILFSYEFKSVDSTLPRLVQNLRDVDQTVRADTAVALLQYVQRQVQFGKSGEPELIIPEGQGEGTCSILCNVRDYSLRLGVLALKLFSLFPVRFERRRLLLGE
jgi:HEAT repeat protein